MFYSQRLSCFIRKLKCRLWPPFVKIILIFCFSLFGKNLCSREVKLMSSFPCQSSNGEDKGKSNTWMICLPRKKNLPPRVVSLARRGRCNAGQHWVSYFFSNLSTRSNIINPCPGKYTSTLLSCIIKLTLKIGYQLAHDFSKYEIS